MIERYRILAHSFLLYAATLALGIWTVWRHVLAANYSGVVQVDLTLGNGFMFLIVFAVFTFAMVRFGRMARMALPVLLIVVMLAGANFVASGWLTWPWSLLAALAAAALLMVVPIVITHDVAVAIGIAGLSAMLGMSLTPLIACAALALLSVYDIVSVYRTRHMVSLADNMLSSGAVFGFLVPARLSGFFLSRRKALDSRQVMMLGSGDIGLPLLLVASTVSQSLVGAIIVAAFTLVGLSVMHWLFSHQRERLPMAALPPIAMFAILGYVTAILLGV
jgi:presenilin-like A22 family membrane protease